MKRGELTTQHRNLVIHEIMEYVAHIHSKGKYHGQISSQSIIYIAPADNFVDFDTLVKHNQSAQYQTAEIISGIYTCIYRIFGPSAAFSGNSSLVRLRLLATMFYKRFETSNKRKSWIRFRMIVIQSSASFWSHSFQKIFRALKRFFNSKFSRSLQFSRLIEKLRWCQQ